MPTLQEMHTPCREFPDEDPWAAEIPEKLPPSREVEGEHQVWEAGHRWRAARDFAAETGRLPNEGELRKLTEGVRDPLPDLLHHDLVFGVYPRVLITAPQQFPWSAVCHLEITNAFGGVEYGTGWLISPRTVITAGHCVCSRSGGPGGRVRAVTVTPGRSGEYRPFGSQTSTDTNSVDGWTLWGQDAYDYGVIQLTSPFTINPGYFGCVALPDAALAPLLASVPGYPLDKPGITPWVAAGPVALQPQMLFYNLDTYAGQSGAPIFVMQGNQPIVVGIHGGNLPNTNNGVRVTPTSLGVLRGWQRF